MRAARAGRSETCLTGHRAFRVGDQTDRFTCGHGNAYSADPVSPRTAVVLAGTAECHHGCFVSGHCFLPLVTVSSTRRTLLTVLSALDNGKCGDRVGYGPRTCGSHRGGLALEDSWQPRTCSDLGGRCL